MTEIKLSAIEKALAAAKARKAAKEAAGLTEETPAPKAKKEPKPKAEKPTKAPKAAKAAKEPKAKTVDPTKEAAKAERLAAKAAKMAELETQRAERKAAREAAKAQREATRAATKSTPGSAHMKKVEKARAKLMPLSTEAEALFSEIVGNFGGAMAAAIADHVKLHVRLMATQRSNDGRPLPVGTTVRIVGGEVKYLNMVGTVVKSQKLRSFVKVEGVRKDVYVFTSDLKVVEEQQLAVAV
jgi:hypothetical protein